MDIQWMIITQPSFGSKIRKLYNRDQACYQEQLSYSFDDDVDFNSSC